MTAKKALSEELVLMQELEISYGSIEAEEAAEEYRFSQIEGFLWIEVALLTNVFLSGFDGTVTASTYTTIGNGFGAAHLASWITTSYLITSTAFQPLYGSISDVIGRRKCVFFASACFSFGCVGCWLAPNIFILNLLRALTGVGGGGLITMSTIVNSDIVPTRKRGLLQALQNLLLGLGAVCGASFGGLITQALGWRWCFLIQVPPAFWSCYVGYFYIRNQPGFDPSHATFDRDLIRRLDIRGLAVLVMALTVQLLALTLGGNALKWSDWRLLMLALLGILLLVYFVYVEWTTKANPIIPLKRFNSAFTYLLMGQNFMIGLSAYAYLFALPQLFQLVLGDTATKAGLRLAIPALATPIGGLITGILMNKYSLLKSLVYLGTAVMALGNFLVLLIGPETPEWLVTVLLVPANVGQGLVYPSSLFTFIFAYGPENQATSTSTTYLMRSIGGVWGVSSVSAIIQAFLRVKVTADLQESGNYSQHKIANLIAMIAESTDNIFTLPEEIRGVILKDYEDAIRLAQFFSSFCCVLGFSFCVLRDVYRSKSTTEN